MKTSLATDRRYLRRALELARLGAGLTLPNPRVGAVLVRGGKIIGEGYHQRAGSPHAEVYAVADAKKRGHAVAGATLYVTLEPCSTHGRTPPCTNLILREKIARVVFAATDPNPAHAGAAKRLLRAAGVEVSSGLFAEEAAALNRDFNWWIVRQRPWVVAKIALSLDGRTSSRRRFGDDPLVSPRPPHELSRTNCAGNRTPFSLARKPPGRTIRASRSVCPENRASPSPGASSPLVPALTCPAPCISSPRTGIATGHVVFQDRSLRGNHHGAGRMEHLAFTD